MEQDLVSLEATLVRQQQQFEESKRAMVTYGGAQQVPSLDDQPNVIVDALYQTSDAVVEAMRRRLQKEAVYSQVRDLDPTSDEAAAVSAIARHPAVQSARVLLTDSQKERTSLSLRYGDKHPTLVTLNASIESAAEQLRTETERAFRSVQREYELAYDEERQLQAQLETQTWLAADLSRQSASTYLLGSDAESNQRIYALLVRRQKQLHVIRNSIENNVQLMDRAGVPETPLVRSSSRDWAITVLFGLLLSVGLAFGIDYFDDTIKTPDDVVRRLQTPILSVLPAVRGGSVSLMSGTVSHEFGEAVRSLRSALTFTEGTGSTRIIAVTSAGPGEGKTTVASNLAMAFALGGAKVLLLDADMRRPSIHKQLGMTNAIGLSHVLVGQARIDEAIQATHDPHLFVLTAGHPPPNPSELLSSLQMKRVWASLKTGSFDWVIVDTPPVLAVTDPVVVAQYASGIVFLAGDRRTRTRHAQHALETLGAGGARVIETVLNHADYDRDKYYYSRNWGSGYTEDLHVTAAA